MALCPASVCFPKHSLPPYRPLATTAPGSSGLPLSLDRKELYCFTLGSLGLLEEASGEPQLLNINHLGVRGRHSARPCSLTAGSREDFGL